MGQMLSSRDSIEPSESSGSAFATMIPERRMSRLWLQLAFAATALNGDIPQAQRDGWRRRRWSRGAVCHDDRHGERARHRQHTQQHKDRRQCRQHDSVPPFRGTRARAHSVARASSCVLRVARWLPIPTGTQERNSSRSSGGSRAMPRPTPCSPVPAQLREPAQYSCVQHGVQL